MTTTTAAAAANEAPVYPSAKRAHPSLAHLTWAHARHATAWALHTPEFIGFTVIMNLGFLCLFLAVFSQPYEIPRPDGTTLELSARGMTVATYLAAMSLWIAYTGTVNQAGEESATGWLRRYAMSGTTRASYVFARYIAALALMLPSAALVIGIGLGFGVRFDTSPSRVLVVVAVLLLSLVLFTSAGVAVSGVVTRQSQLALVSVMPALVLMLVSGMWVPTPVLPEVLHPVMLASPLYWAAQIVRWAVLGDDYGALEIGGAFHLDTAWLVLGGWSVAMVALSLLLFSWKKKP